MGSRKRERKASAAEKCFYVGDDSDESAFARRRGQPAGGDAAGTFPRRKIRGFLRIAPGDFRRVGNSADRPQIQVIAAHCFQRKSITILEKSSLQMGACGSGSSFIQRLS